MRKNVIFIAVCFLCLFVSCSGKKDFSGEQGLLGAWAQASKNKDYSLYSKTAAYPRTAEQFNEMYKDYFIADLCVVEVSSPSSELKDSNGEAFIKKEASFTAASISRKDNKKILITGTAELIKFKKASSWLISGRILNFSE